MRNAELGDHNFTKAHNVGQWVKRLLSPYLIKLLQLPNQSKLKPTKE